MNPITSRLYAVATALLSLGLAACPDATQVADQCVAADLIGQCPVGSNPVLGAEASSSCGGEFNANIVTEEGSATGQCGSNGTCQFLCQFSEPCTCGVATISKESIVCSECQDQSCGDGRCEGTERAFCEPGQAGCFACEEDCAGPTCGDGDCTGTENPQSCPQDCAATCTPDASVCIGTRVSKCAADGHTSVEFDCATVGQACSVGACVAPNVCGNGICDGVESAASCAQDCSTLCQPASRSCEGDKLVVCAADGQSKNETDCAASSQICVNGQCRAANVCGNGACEAGESATCAQDCAAVCGNGQCENNEQTTCPADCTTCGNDSCEAGEITSCPQDCGICVPSEKQCLAKTLRVCNANGAARDDIDCNALGLTCGGGDCVEAGVCGNGLCDAGETEATCLEDCTEVCGNNQCNGLETFLTCAIDCDPVCGDGTCEGNEDSITCSFDCLATCNDGLCNPPESRSNCPRDCGSCGDGLCQDGFESASLNPPANLESCVVDCVVTGCGEDSDCDDELTCTANQCLNGSCIYTPNDDLCAGDDKCIRLNGCCPDGDGDGYADMACGGSDCNDADPDVHPGALEVCGGGDKNCNGQHKPALLPAKKLTNSASFKQELMAVDIGGSFILTWTGKPATTQHLELLEVGWDLLPKAPVATNNDIEVNDVVSRVSVAWNPTRQKLGAMWMLAETYTIDAYGPAWESRVAWLDKDGSIDGEPEALVPNDTCTVSLGPSLSTFATGAVAVGDTVVFPTELVGYNGGYPTQPPNQLQGGPVYELLATGNAVPTWGAGDCKRLDDAMIQPVILDGLMTGLRFRNGSNLQNPGWPTAEEPAPGTFVSLDLGGTAYTAKAELQHASSVGSCALGSDGELLAVVCSHQSKVYYHRATQAGGVFVTDEVLAGAHVPIAVGRAKLPASGAANVGVALRDDGGNLWFFVRDAAGEEVLAPAVIGGGDAIRSAEVLHDGNDFVVVWLAKTGGFEQAYAQRITCE